MDNYSILIYLSVWESPDGQVLYPDLPKCVVAVYVDNNAVNHPKFQSFNK